MQFYLIMYGVLIFIMEFVGNIKDNNDRSDYEKVLDKNFLIFISVVAFIITIFIHIIFFSISITVNHNKLIFNIGIIELVIISVHSVTLMTKQYRSDYVLSVSSPLTRTLETISINVFVILSIIMPFLTH